VKRSKKTTVALGAAMALKTVASLFPALKFLSPISTCARRLDKSNQSAPDKWKIGLAIAMVVSTVLIYVPSPWPWLHWLAPLVAIAIDWISLKEDV